MSLFGPTFLPSHGSTRGAYSTARPALLADDPTRPSLADLPLDVIRAHIDPHILYDKIRNHIPGSNDSERLYRAAAFGNLRAVNFLVENVEGVDAAAYNNFAIRLASANGHLAVVERLLTVEGVDTTALDNEAIRWASRNGHLPVVERLLTVEGMDAAADDNYAVL